MYGVCGHTAVGSERGLVEAGGFKRGGMGVLELGLFLRDLVGVLG